MFRKPALPTLLFLLILPFLNACNNDCSRFNSSCEFGVCVYGDCQCDEGYEGDRCGVLMGDKFQGDYEMNYLTQTVINGDSLPISPSTISFNNVNGPTLTGETSAFLGFPFPIHCTMTSTNEFEIEFQGYGNILIEGNGIMLDQNPGSRVIDMRILVTDLESLANLFEIELTEIQ